MRFRIVRATQKKFTVSVAVVIVNENEKILLLNHVLRSDSGWGIPGGFMQSGEQPEAAVKREIREETGLELKNIKLLGMRTTNRHIEFLYRASPVGTARVRSLEINELGWFKINEMPEKMSQIQKKIIEEVLSSEYKVLID